MATTGICGFIMQALYDDELNSVVMPMVIIFALSFMVASMFMVVMETTTDTIFLCFLVDDVLNGNSPQSYAPKELKALVEKHSEFSKQKADEVKAAHSARHEAIRGGGRPPAAAGSTPPAGPDAGPPPSASVALTTAPSS